MRRTEQAQGLRLMRRGLRAVAVCWARRRRRRLGAHLRRWRDRFEADGAEGRRRGPLGAPRADRGAGELFDTRYWDFTAKHFHEKLVAEHGCGRSQLGAADLTGVWAGAHRRKRPRRALPGMMVHQDGSRHEWLAGQAARPDRLYSAIFVEDTMSSFRALSEVIGERGLFCSLYRPGQRHTPARAVDKDNPTQVGRALQRLGIELIGFARGQGAVRAHVRLPCRRLRELRRRRDPRPTAEVSPNTTPAATPAEDQGTACVDDILSRTAPSLTTTPSYKRLALQIPADRHRRHSSRPRSALPDARAVFHGPRCLARYKRTAGDPTRPKRGQVDAAPRLTFPTGPTTATEAVNSSGT